MVSWLFPEPEGDEAQSEHNGGTEGWRRSRFFGIVVHAMGKSFLSDAYNKGFEHGASNQPNEDDEDDD